LEPNSNTIEKIAAWSYSQAKDYTYFPSELTLPIAQRLTRKLKQATESY
jgi:hypothetical protein